MDIKQLSLFTASSISLLAGLAHAEPFVFQGQLNDQGAPADGIYDLEFVLYSIDIGGTQIGPTVTLEDQQVTTGNFLVELDFGDVFDGSQRWIEISVRDGDSPDAFTELTPRLKVGSAPQASYATKAGTADTLSDPFWSQAPGILIFGENGGHDAFLFNRDSVIDPTDLMVLQSSMNGLGGMTISSWANGMPYYGYATNGSMRVQSYYDPATDAWVVNKNGDQLEIDQNNDVIITNNLIVGGTITSMGGSEGTVSYVSHTPETLYMGLSGFGLLFNSTAGAVGTAGTSLYLRADLDLPHGSTITMISVLFVDGSNSTNMRVQLSERELDTLGFTVTTLGDSTGSMGTTVQTMNIVPDPQIVIDSTLKTYDLRFMPSTGNWPSSGLLGVRSVLIEYTTP